MFRRAPLLALVLLALLPGLAQAAPTATSDATYAQLGRVFPDPQAVCGSQGVAGCSPEAEGNVDATSFTGLQEFIDSMTYMQTSAAHPEWKRYMEVWPLDGKLGDGSGTTPGNAMFPGDNLSKLEFTPNPKSHSAGLATTTGGKQYSDIFVVRVTDETVPDKDKKRYALDLSIHGIERAGVEGGLRTIEDLVTASTTPGTTAGRTRLDDRILPASFDAKSLGLKEGGPTFSDVLKHVIIYFTFPNPDGWLRGSATQFGTGNGGVFFQRYNGNGVDVNRDWPDIGFSFRGYSALSEPESRALASFYGQVKSTTNSQFAAGDDLHGQPEADALSFTLLPHGSHDFAKNLRIQETAKLINRVTYKALRWSPIIQDNDQPHGGGAPCAPDPVLGDACAKIYAQTWGSVYDTINYTTTGAIGDWFDSSLGLGADGIDNEMSFSHLDKNIVYEPNTEQLHVDGNKYLIFAHLARMLEPVVGTFDAPGKKGYVPNVRLRRAASSNAPTFPPGTKPSADYDTTAAAPAGSGDIAFPVVRTPAIYNGGFRADVRTTNAAGVGDGMATLSIQCQYCDDHPGVDPDNDGWVTVEQDFNQSPLYLQSGITAAVNFPEVENHTGKKVNWRAEVSGAPPGTLSLHIDFSSGPATSDGDTGGAAAPILAGYDVANTDFFPKLNPYASKGGFDAIDPHEIIAGTQTLDAFDSIVLADSILPGYSATGTSAYTTAEYGTWIAKLRAWVAAGNNLVLTDAALQALPAFSTISAGKVALRNVYAGQMAFSTNGTDTTLDDPLAKNVAQPGARFNDGMRRQTYEPTPLGIEIMDEAGADAYHAPQWDVDKAAFTAAGGRIAATSASDRDVADNTRVTLGELKLGKGEVRIAGALLPQPTEKYDHPNGLEPFAVTYTGYILWRNLLEVTPKAVATPPGTTTTTTTPTTTGTTTTGTTTTGTTTTGTTTPTPTTTPSAATTTPEATTTAPDGTTVPQLTTTPGSPDPIVDTPAPGAKTVACQSTAGFLKATVVTRGGAVAVRFTRRVTRPVSVDIFRTSDGRKVVKERLVARFAGQASTFTWDGKPTTKAAVGDGTYIVRMSIPYGGGRDTRRFALARRSGSFKRIANYYAKAGCATLSAFKLERPVFGGVQGLPLRASYRLTGPAKVAVTISRGAKLVKAFAAQSQAKGGHRFSLAVGKLERGQYAVKLVVTPSSGKAITQTLRSTLI